MTKPHPVEISIAQSIADIGQVEWDACACPYEDKTRPIDPFTTYRFLTALEESGSVGQGTGWVPQYITARVDGKLIGVLPSYAKGHSQGEYIFDHNWAHAFENAGGRYYPKLQIAAPFTPVTGRRFLTHPDHIDVARAALTQGIHAVLEQQQWSSAHITFCTEEEYNAAPELGLMQRLGQQFHWVNNDYKSFDDFLSCLSSRKRKNLRKERAAAANFGGTFHEFTGDEIQPEHWDAFWEFYMDTGARKWGTPYLTREFFQIAHETMRDDIVLFLCERDGQWVAGALNFIGQNTLFGRYWGCTEHHPFLHFELSYYRAIDYAIEHNLKTVEAGAQGEHKLARGYLPTPTYSLHYFQNAGFAEAVQTYLTAERDAVGQDIEILTSYGPFKNMKEE
jgi:predicted N-acyltransferase